MDTVKDAIQSVKDTVASTLGSGDKSSSGSKVRYGVVAAGWISQAFFMPGVAQTTNSSMTVLVTDDDEKATKLAKQYALKSYKYNEFHKALEAHDVDAWYIATPNFRHAEFAVPALEKGYHVLLEKPMEVTEEACEQILAAQKKGGGKLMIAYRLHCEPGTLHVIDLVRNKKDLGESRLFSSTFSQKLKDENHRSKNGFEAGPAPDVGLYCINAVRNLFGTEPIEVTATGFKSPDAASWKLEYDTISVTMRFPEEKSAQFVVSYTASGSNSYRVIGTKGEISVDPAFLMGSGFKLTYKTKIEGKESTKTFDEYDQFAGETEYFSDCIQKNREVEPDGEEGLMDVRVICAIKKSLESGGQPQKLSPATRKTLGNRGPQLDQEVKLSLPKQVNTFIGRDSQPPSKDL